LSWNLEQVRWHSEKERGSINQVRTADLDGNGTIEIVARIGDNVVVYDHTGKELWCRQPVVDAQLNMPHGYRSVATRNELVDDVNGDGRPELCLLQEWDSHVDTPIGDYAANHCYE